MKCAALLVPLLLCVSSPLLGQNADKPEDILSRARRAIDDNRPEEARSALEGILEQHPISHLKAEVLYELSRCAALEGKKAEESYLRRILQEFPESSVASHARQRLLEVKGLHFSTLPRSVCWGDARPLTVEREHEGAKSPPSIYAFYFLPEDAYLEALEAHWSDESESVGDSSLEFPREKCQLLSRFEVNFENADRKEVPAPWARPGLYFIEEEVDGLRTTHRLRVQTFAAACKPSAPRYHASGLRA